MEQNQPNNQNLNLLNSSYYTAPVALRVRSKLILVTKITIIAIETIFLLILFLEFRSNQNIRRTLEGIESIEKLYKQKGFDEAKVHNLIERIAYYKELQTRTKSNAHSAKIDLILKQANAEFKLLGLNSSNLNEVAVSVETQNALAISFFIDSMLKNNTVNEVYLDQVNLISGQNLYNSEMIITFK